MKVVAYVAPDRPKRCVPRVINWNWFFNRGPHWRRP